MQVRFGVLISVAVGFVLLFSHKVQTQSSVALAGRVISAEEGAMEGVLEIGRAHV